MSSTRKVVLWVLAPLIAATVATYASLLLASGSFVSDAIPDFLHRWPKWYRSIFWRAYYPTCGYFAWRPITKGRGKGHSPWSRCGYRWFWRKPRHPNWDSIAGWHVFYG